MLFVGNSRLNNFTGNTRGKYKNKRTTHGMMLTTSFFQKEKRNNYMEILPFFFLLCRWWSFNNFVASIFVDIEKSKHRKTERSAKHIFSKFIPWEFERIGKVKDQNYILVKYHLFSVEIFW